MRCIVMTQALSPSATPSCGVDVTAAGPENGHRGAWAGTNAMLEQAMIVVQVGFFLSVISWLWLLLWLL